MDHYLSAHREFLQHYYASHHFIVSGGLNPRCGGVILCKVTQLDEVQQIISNDPLSLLLSWLSPQNSIASRLIRSKWGLIIIQIVYIE